jgi:hypothetical protein
MEYYLHLGCDFPRFARWASGRGIEGHDLKPTGRAKMQLPRISLSTWARCKRGLHANCRVQRVGLAARTDL